MTQAPGHEPNSQDPMNMSRPKQVAASGVLMCLQAVGIVVLAILILASGFRHAAATGQLLGQVAYFLVIAAAMVACGLALLGGRRWGRTPTIVVQIVLAAVGYWLAVPSGRLVWGVGLILLAVVTGGLLMTKPANDWISRFPSLFAPEPGR